jgi:predicted nucleotidyltransferase component of viral defense system
MKLHTETTSALLWDILNQLMGLGELASFRLVGGTSLSLQLGHRISVDIDMFSDAVYGSINFGMIDSLLQNTFGYVDLGLGNAKGMGKSYFIGYNKDNMVKLDLFYTDPFKYPIIAYQGLRLSRLEEVTAMKLEVIGQNGRKKDFWDIYELRKHFSWKDMLGFYEQRYPYGHTKEELVAKLTDFTLADSDLDPICLKGNYWELIKLDIEEEVREAF